MCLHNQICHVMASGAVLEGLHFGMTLVLPSSYFQSSKSIKTIYEERCSAFYATPVLCIDLVEECERVGVSMNHVELALICGEPCPKKVAEQVLDVMRVQRIYMAYDLTECGIAFMSKTRDTREQMTNTLGHVTAHVEVKVVDAAGRMVPMGYVGEIWVRSHGRMMGYWGDEEKTKNVVTPSNWVRTGDLGILQVDGYGRIVGRIKDIIIRGCEKMFPIDIEDFFLAHPYVLEVQALGVPDTCVGQEVVVCIRPKKGRLITEDMIVEYCQGKVPKYIRVLSEFPRNIGEKVKMYKLKEMMLLELGLAGVS